MEDRCPLASRKIAASSLAFACVYFFWGSTYSAFYIAGLHLAPPLVGFIRSLFSTTLIWRLLPGARKKPARPLAYRMAALRWSAFAS